MLFCQGVGGITCSNTVITHQKSSQLHTHSWDPELDQTRSNQRLRCAERRGETQSRVGRAWCNILQHPERREGWCISPCLGLEKGGIFITNNHEIWDLYPLVNLLTVCDMENGLFEISWIYPAKLSMGGSFHSYICDSYWVTSFGELNLHDLSLSELPPTTKCCSEKNGIRWGSLWSYKKRWKITNFYEGNQLFL